MEKLVLGVTGSKTFENKRKIKEFIHKLKNTPDVEVEIVSLGDRHGADQHVKKFALEMGLAYRELNAAHTTKNLYSLMSEAYYDKPYHPRNFHQQIKIFSQFVSKCVVFDDTGTTDKKVQNLLKQLTKLKKKTIIMVP